MAKEPGNSGLLLFLANPSKAKRGRAFQSSPDHVVQMVIFKKVAPAFRVLDDLININVNMDAMN